MVRPCGTLPRLLPLQLPKLACGRRGSLQQARQRLASPAAPAAAAAATAVAAAAAAAVVFWIVCAIHANAGGMQAARSGRLLQAFYTPAQAYRSALFRSSSFVQEACHGMANAHATHRTAGLCAVLL